MRFPNAIIVAGALSLACIFAMPARAESALEFAAAGMGRQAVAAPARAHGRARRHSREIAAPAHIRTMIADAVCARIGCRWTPVALRIARIESGFRCGARNGRAVGVFQTTNPAMFGVSRSAALTCAGGVSAGVAHMAMCVRLGAQDAAQMMRCHNSGSPRGRVDHVYLMALAGRL